MLAYKAPWTRRFRASLATVSRRIKQIVGNAKKKIDLDTQFAHLAQKWERISTGIVNLHSSFLGIFDREALTVTVRADGALKQGELLETNHVQYRVRLILAESVHVPVEIHQITHMIPCKVAILSLI